MRKAFLSSLIIVFLFCSVKVGVGAEPNDEGHVYAIQDRVFHRYHEIGLSLGYIPDDDFYEVYPVGASYTYNFDDYLAWEVLRAEWMLSQEKDLKGELETYSDNTLSLLFRDMTALVKRGVNGSEMVYEALVRELGYGSIEEAERAQKRGRTSS